MILFKFQQKVNFTMILIYDLFYVCLLPLHFYCGSLQHQEFSHFHQKLTSNN